MKRLFTVLVAVCVMVLGGCNTMEGIGEDMEAAGEGIEKKAEEKKGY